MLAALCYNIADIDESVTSLIQFYEIHFNQSQHVSMNKLYVYISPQTLNFDTFEVSALDFIPHTSYLVICIINYGLIVYDTETFNPIPVKIVSLIPTMRFQPFSIVNIVTKNEND